MDLAAIKKAIQKLQDKGSLTDEVILKVPPPSGEDARPRLCVCMCCMCICVFVRLCVCLFVYDAWSRLCVCVFECLCMCV